MIIYSMTATFGKLQHQTLTLNAGLNILEAPNEWGKSTWCAFLVAMLYGIDSRVHGSTKTGLADKTRYDPWSGEPMSGRIELCWNGRDITIERTSTKRSQFRQFSAFETQTGLLVPELNADNCGQVLLGVEKEVFLRAGFLRQGDLPVTQSEALRRRLNALVTTGDESGAADLLATQLNKLKNECRANRSKGLLPQAQAMRDDLLAQLTELDALSDQLQKLQSRQTELEAFLDALTQHKAFLNYRSAETLLQQIRNAEERKTAAEQTVQALSHRCAQLPDAQILQRKLDTYEQLQQQMLSLQLESQMLPRSPEPPKCPMGADGTDPDVLIRSVHASRFRLSELERNRKKATFPYWLPGVLISLLGAGLLLLHPLAGKIILAAGILFTIFGLVASLVSHKKHKTALANAAAYENTLCSEAEINTYRDRYTRYRQQLEEIQKQQNDLNGRMQTFHHILQKETGGKALSTCISEARSALDLHQQHTDAHRDLLHADALLQSLLAMPLPTMPSANRDPLTYTEDETNRLLSDTRHELRQIQLHIGHYQGQMAAFPPKEVLTKKRDQLDARIRKLNLTLDAIGLAQSTLTEAANELQRKFSPRIVQRAKKHFHSLTQGRYDRVSLGDDLNLLTSAQGEDTLRSILWRSDGTIDQLYFALRLAVAQELTPHAPLILDDALIRFDDLRMQRALDILQSESKDKQILLFTCQHREKAYLNNQ